MAGSINIQAGDFITWITSCVCKHASRDPPTKSRSLVAIGINRDHFTRFTVTQGALLCASSVEESQWLGPWWGHIEDSPTFMAVSWCL